MRENQYRILIMHDDSDRNRTVQQCLEGEGHQVGEASSLVEILEAEKEALADLVIIDTVSRGVQGFTAIQEIRRSSRIPVIALTRQGRVEDRVLGMNLGADDCMESPFEALELGARINALLRRCYEMDTEPTEEEQTEEKSTLRYDELELNMSRLRLYKNDSSIPLTPKEYRLMLNMMNEPGRIFTKEELCRMIFDSNLYSDANALMVHISHLREKIEEDPKNPRYIFNIRGKGYRFGKAGE